MLLILDFDGVFAPYHPFWEALEIYATEKGVTINDAAVDAIKKSVVKNQNELNLTLNNLGIADLKYLGDLYYQRITLNQGAGQFLDFCNANDLKYVFFSSASPERLITTFSKHNIHIHPEDVYFARSKDYPGIVELKEKLFSRFGPIKNIVYLDDYPLALVAGKKNDFTTILMSDESLSFGNLVAENDDFIDYKIDNFLELKDFILNVL